jgi:hypothetical protein
MACAEFQRLKQEYERTLRVWAHYAFPLTQDVVQSPGRLSQLKYEAQRARDRAAKRLSAHHTFGTDLFKATKDPFLTRDLVGHRSVNHRAIPAPGATSCGRLDGRSQPDPARIYVIIYVIGD